MNLKTALLEHQKAATDKMMRSRVGALFMEMGTGKTRVAIELVYRRQSVIKNVVYFCPVSLKQNTWKEIQKHVEKPNKDFWNIIGIESMQTSIKTITKAQELITKDTFVIVDESSFIKNHKAKRTEHITIVSKPARYRLIMTGTPIQKGYPDLYSQLYFLSPLILGYNSWYSFAANHIEYSEKYKGVYRAHNIGYLAAKMEPYVYQVTKTECLDLPDKIYTQRYFTMTRNQKELYEHAKDEILNSIYELDSFGNTPSYIIYNLFTCLQTVLSGYLNMKDEHCITDNPRLDLLIDVIEETAANKIIIWCKYQYDIEQITQKLGLKNCALFYGELSENERNNELDKFRNTDTRFFIATQSCGGFGLTLVESAYVIYYNNSFNYAARQQSEDRTHRIGQTKKVQYVDLICEKSIDEMIDDNLTKKGNIVSDFKNKINQVKTKEGLKKLITSL
jgi:SNF2 family DNA or RNA helicase